MPRGGATHDASLPRATGVYVEIDGIPRHARARREVILAGGTINTPQLLMLSGIGPAAHLSEIGIDVRADLPVGEGLQDHIAPLMIWSRPTNTSAFRDALRFDRMALAMVKHGSLLYRQVFAVSAAQRGSWQRLVQFASASAANPSTDNGAVGMADSPDPGNSTITYV